MVTRMGVVQDRIKKQQTKVVSTFKVKLLSLDS